jgi:signal peptidase
MNRISRSALRRLPLVLAIAVFAGWYVLLAPTSIGGPASYVWVSGTSMEPTLRTGDFVVLRRAEQYGIGDIVAYRIPAGEPAAGTFVIHRIVGGSADTGFVTQGDNKDGPDRWQPTSGDVLGAQVFVWAGGARVIGWLRDPAVFASLAAGVTVFVVMLTDWGSGTTTRASEWLSRRTRRSREA